jgi:hypothetical protein
MIHVKTVPGTIDYTNHKRKKLTFCFQCTPTSLTRSRTVSRIDTQAGNPVGSVTDRGAAGRKFTHKTSIWQIEPLELWFDASRPYWTSPTTLNEKGSVKAVEEGIAHLEAIIEPGPVPSEIDPVTGAPPLPSPPLLQIRFGTKNVWYGYASSVTILMKELTPDLRPRLVKATLAVELVEPPQQDKPGARL